jgi:DNA-binding NtrC family response regulator
VAEDLPISADTPATNALIAASKLSLSSKPRVALTASRVSGSSLLGMRAAEVTSLLIVDDDEAVLKMTKKALERRGYRVVACRSGDEALGVLSRESFDCMISDVRMPGINGVRLLRAIRDRDLDLPVVLVTGNPDVETAAAAVEYGAFQYLSKPVGNDRLDETVERAANAGRLARAKREYAEQYGSGVFLAGDRASVDATLDRALAFFVNLDMSLIRDVHESEAKQKIIGSMVNLCHEMGKQIVAEGVEQAAERDALVELGCDFLQGYFFAKPGKLPLLGAA